MGTAMHAATGDEGADADSGRWGSIWGGQRRVERLASAAVAATTWGPVWRSLAKSLFRSTSGRCVGDADDACSRPLDRARSAHSALTAPSTAAMAPSAVSSKGKAKPGSKPSAPPRSRNTTPLPTVRASVEPPSSSTASYFSKPLGTFLRRCNTTVEEILDSGGSSSHIPSGSRLLAMRDQVEKTVLKNIEARCTQSEGALRELHGLRKNRVPRDRDKDKDADERDRDRDRKHKLKKVTKKHDDDSKHPPTTGAHALARQDGGDAAKGTSCR